MLNWLMRGVFWIIAEIARIGLNLALKLDDKIILKMLKMLKKLCKMLKPALPAGAVLGLVDMQEIFEGGRAYTDTFRYMISHTRPEQIRSIFIGALRNALNIW